MHNYRTLLEKIWAHRLTNRTEDLQALLKLQIFKKQHKAFLVLAILIKETLMKLLSKEMLEVAKILTLEA